MTKEADEEGVVDREVLERLRAIAADTEPGLVDDLVGRFVSEMPAQLERLRQAASVGNAGQLAFLAHRLKSSAASLGASRAASAFEALEHAARAPGGLAGARPLITALEDAMTPTLVALAAERRPNRAACLRPGTGPA